MIKRVCFLLFSVSVMACLSINAQEITDTLVTGKMLIEKGINLHNKGEYQLAIDEYKKVSPSDPDYTWACYEIALSYYYNNQNLLAISKCNEAISLEYNDPLIYSLLGSIYDDSGDQKKGIEVIKKGLQKWPYNQPLLYNLAVCYQNNSELLKAEETLIKSLRVNPYHASSNLALAKVNFKLGRRAQSYLAYNMAIILNPGRKFITNYEETVSGHNDSLDQGYNYPALSFNQPFQWEKLKFICKSDLVGSNALEFPFKVNYTITRQSYALFRSLAFEAADTSFYSQFYARFFTDMMEKGHFNAFTYYVLKELGIADIDQWIKNNQVPYNAFVDWAKEEINRLRATSFSYNRELDHIVYYHFDKNGDLTAIGNLVGEKSPLRQGKFTYIGTDGQVTEKGYFVNDKTEGKWYIFNLDGSIQQLLNFANDRYEDTTFSYFPNGAVSGVYPMSEGSKNGVELHYSPSGLLKSKFTYSRGVLQGPAYYCNFSKGFKQEYMNNNNVTEGVLIETWLNGIQKSEIHYLNDQYHGSYKSWYANGAPEKEYEYSHGKEVGPFVEFFSNGNKRMEGMYDSTSNLTGTYTIFYNNNQIAYFDSVYVEGKLTGISKKYAPDGKLMKYILYNNDLINSYSFYDKQSNILYQADSKDSSVYIKTFYENGVLEQEGLNLKGKFSGLWKSYDGIGNLTEEKNYRDGMLAGIQKEYYPNGNLKALYTADSNMIIGLYQSFYNNGHLKQKGFYDRDGQTGEWLSWYPNDSLQTRSYLDNGEYQGRVFYYQPDGFLSSIETYNSDGDAIKTTEFYLNNPDTLDYQWGKFEFKTHYPGGQLWKIVRLTDHMLNGLQEEYYPNGQLKRQSNYTFGQIDGTYKTWDYLGNLTYSGNYSLGDQQGSEEWYNDGKLIYKVAYVEGKREGIGTDYYTNGNIMRKMELSDNRRNGYTEYYAPDGILMYRLRFIDGYLVAWSYPDKTGKFINDISITPDTKLIQAFYQNGKMSVKIPLKKGMYHGKFESWYASGSKLREADFVDDDSHGNETIYYANGKVKEATVYNFDEKDGAYRLYYENGKIYKEGQYLLGNEHGEWKIYSVDGKLSEILMYNNGILYEIRKP